MILGWFKLEVIACSESFPTIGHMPNFAEKQEYYGYFNEGRDFRPIGSGEGARSGPQRNQQRTVLSIARSGETLITTRACLHPAGSRELLGVGFKRPIWSGGAVFWCGSFRKRDFQKKSINRCLNTPFIVLFIIIHKLEREKAIERVLERFCNLSWIFIDS